MGHLSALQEVVNEVLQEIGIDACCLGSLDWCKNVWKKPWESPD
jgi:hypothetical protein